MFGTFVLLFLNLRILGEARSSFQLSRQEEQLQCVKLEVTGLCLESPGSSRSECGAWACLQEFFSGS